MASFHSISFPSEWGVTCPEGEEVVKVGGSFHSISFPSEWGEDIVEKQAFLFTVVSIQLVSPASGEIEGRLVKPGDLGRQARSRFHSISFPSEWGDTLFCT
jgi:hypothetical protein